METEETQEQDQVEVQEVFQFVLGEGQSGMKLVPVHSGNEQENQLVQDEGVTLTALTSENGVTYFQVVSEAEGEGGQSSESHSNITQPIEVSGEETQTVLYEQSEETSQESGKGTDESTVIAATTSTDDEEYRMCKLQWPPKYQYELLQSIERESFRSFFDFPVFCQDGVAWSNKLILAGTGSSMRNLFLELEKQQITDTCLILPEITKLEFTTFHRALFSKEGDAALDFMALIKVAEVLNADLMLTASFPSNESNFPQVDYRTIFESREVKSKVFRSLGYEVDVMDSGPTLDPLGNNKQKDALSKVSALLGSNDFNCTECGRTFVDKTSLDKHIALLHSEDQPKASEGKYKCLICNRLFAYAVSVKKHQWLVHRNIPFALTKEVKGRPVDKTQAKMRRLQEKIEDMKCSVCEFKANTWKQLQVHMMDHTKERPYRCKICERGFKEPQKLKRHELIHSGEKKFKCRFCQRAFTMKHNMISHEKLHEGKGYNCDYCGKLFSHVTNFRDHRKQHASLKHQITDDPDLRAKQTIPSKKKGRPSILSRDISSQDSSNHDPDEIEENEDGEDKNEGERTKDEKKVAKAETSEAKVLSKSLNRKMSQDTTDSPRNKRVKK